MLGGTIGQAAEPIAARLEWAREALHADAIFEAARQAEAAFDLAENTGDLGDAAQLRLSEPFLERVFLRRLGSRSRRLFPERVSPARSLLRSPREAFLLSRLDADMSVEEALDVSAMPRLETLRRLVQLVARGAVRLE